MPASEQIAVGIDLDAEVARMVFGHAKQIRIPTVGEPHYWCLAAEQPGTVLGKVPLFSTNLTDAWMIVNHLIGLGFQFELSYMPSEWWPNEATPVRPEQRWQCYFTGFPGTDMLVSKGIAATKEEAICRAALAALQTETTNA